MERETITIQTLISRLSWNKRQKEKFMNDLMQFYGLSESDTMSEKDFLALLHENYQS